MNRRKKIKTILTKRSKQANLKANPKKAKPKYISKAERAKLESEETTQISENVAASATEANEDPIEQY
ncbi:DUF2986 domain-containing protein [Marinomonas sp.]